MVTYIALVSAFKVAYIASTFEREKQSSISLLIIPFISSEVSQLGEQSWSG